jgi:hypothetical protein
MPAKRTKAKDRRLRITPEVVAAYRAGDEVLLDGLLGLKPWEASPIGINSADQPSPWPPGAGGASSWPQAIELWKQLEEIT